MGVRFPLCPRGIALAMDERPLLDDQKGPKTHATPAGVDRKDLSEAGPADRSPVPGAED